MSVIRRIQIGENHKSAEVLNRTTDDIQTLSGLTLGETFPGFATVPALAATLTNAKVYAAGLVRAPFAALASSGTVVPAAPYPVVASGAANFGPVAGQTSLEFVNIAQTHRVRQNGTVTRLRVYLAATTGITGLYLKVWRLNAAGTYDLAGMSANVGGTLTGATINSLTLATVVPVLEGDYLGLRVEYSAASVQNFFASAVANTTLGQSGGIIYSVLNATPATAAYDWTLQTATAASMVLLGVDMAAPVLVTIGDSITSGLRGTCAFSDNYTNVVNLGDSYPTKVAKALGYTYQNMGIGGQTAAQMAARFAADVVALAPRIAIIMSGVNDIYAGVTNTAIIASVTSMLDAAKAAGIIPVVIGTTPFRTGVSVLNAWLQQRDALNVLLQALVTSATYNGYYVNPDKYLGQYYPGGDAGNLWQLKASFDGSADTIQDGIHPNAAGYTALAQAVMDVLAPVSLIAGAAPSQVTQSKGKIGIGTTTPVALLTVNAVSANGAGSQLVVGSGYVKTDTTERYVATLAQASDVTNPFQVTVGLIGAATLALRRAVVQTADDGLANGGLVALQPHGGTVCVGQATTNPNSNPFAVGYGFVKTDTSSRRASALAQSSDGSNPFVLVTAVTGAATQANRVASLQTAEEGVANAGTIGLQASGGAVAIGAGATTPANASAILDVVSTTQGVLFPRMTSTQRDAIASPAEGLVVYNLTTHKLNVRTAAAWEAITSV